MKEQIIKIMTEFAIKYASFNNDIRPLEKVILIEEDFPAIAEKISQLDRWVKVSERLPTKDDIDKKGNVLGWDRIQNEVHKCHFIDIAEMKTRFTHWMPLPKLPSIPE